VKGSVCMKCEEREDVVSEAPSRKLPPPKRARTETGGKQTRLVLNSVKSSSFYPGPTRLEGLKEVEGGMQVNGGSRVLQPKPAARDASPAAPAAKRTRQQLQQVQQHANQVAASLQKLGTADNPITLDSDDEAGPSAPAPAATRRPTRSTAYASASERLQGLRCLMPPTGGPGSVEFTAGDYARLGPDEFLNDTAIDYYLCHLKEELQEKYPADAERCYFFNSFFYKKLSEKSGERQSLIFATHFLLSCMPVFPLEAFSSILDTMVQQRGFLSLSDS